MGCHFLLQGISPTQGEADSLLTELQGKPRVLAKTGFKCTDEPRKSFRNLIKVRPNTGSSSPSGTTVLLSAPMTLGQVQSPLKGLSETLKPVPAQASFCWVGMESLWQREGEELASGGNFYW